MYMAYFFMIIQVFAIKGPSPTGGRSCLEREMARRRLSAGSLGMEPQRQLMRNASTEEDGDRSSSASSFSVGEEECSNVYEAAKGLHLAALPPVYGTPDVTYLRKILPAHENVADILCMEPGVILAGNEFWGKRCLVGCGLVAGMG
jgi:hypothetical protein